MQNLVGRKMQEARQAMNPPLTQDELASRLTKMGFKIDRVGVAKIEGGFRQVRDFEVVKLADALGVSVGWLLGRE
jgi:HTH-type transcriptional regulator, cell division transcriptional repressor